jgi:tetratricopeptide (TPR) repeat protein
LRKQPLFIITCIVLSLASTLGAASLEEAQRLESKGRRDAALEELDELLSSQGPADEMAGALDLLGTIAVDEGDLQLAYQSWNRLVSEYPDFAKPLGATTKLSLVSSLMKATGESPLAQADVSTGAKSVETPPVSPPAKTEVDEAPTSKPSATKAPITAKSEPAAETSQRPNPPPSDGTVLVAFSGKPYDAAVEAGELVIAFLRDQGVNAVSATEGIPVVRDASALVPVMVQRARDDGASSALLVDADFPGRQKVSAECYSPDGAQFWKTKVVGGTGWTGRDYSKTGVNEELVERFTKKLSKMVGGPGLPVTLQ